MRKFILIILSLMVIGISTLSHAALIDRGGGLIYDSDLNVTWLQTASNLPRLWSVTLDGIVGARPYADNFTYYDSVRSVTWSDWRLPTTSASPSGAAGELGHLYYTELGNSPGGPLTNRGPFSNLAGFWYWTGTEVPGSTLGGMTEYYIFNFQDGTWFEDCGMFGMSDGNYVLLVRNGDVGLPPSFLFSLHFNGDSSGYVHNSATSEVCNANCDSTIAGWTTVTLHVTSMDQYAVFGGWAGACTNSSGDCVFTMDATKGATATFNRDMANAVKIDLPAPGVYASLSAAYSNASSGAIIKAWGTWFGENPVFGDEKIISLEGGYNRDFNNNNDFANLIGTLTVGKGSLTVENLMIR
jgi:hypothetical protein